MSTLEIVCGVLVLIASIILIVIVLAQHGKTSALGGSITGGSSESFLSKKGTSTKDERFIRVTRVVAVAFVVLVIVAEVVMAFANHAH
ncbi:MAG TPA: preprotein translocase subunit SecG [Ruminococcaceae bacterium]|nr:preprotein translocase subunit SecG [Oscillospiraceae bacterium]